MQNVTMACVADGRLSNRTSGRVRVEFITQKQSPVLFITDQRESMSYVIYYPVFFTKHRNESLTSIFITFPNPIVLLVTRVIESSISLSYCKLCLIAVLPSKRMGFKPTHINFRVHVISYLTRLYMTQSHFSSVHQTT